jgi:pimeloyl-ACP methyl ester carboxylesterase
MGIGSGLIWLGCLEADRRRVSWLFRSIRYTDRLARGLDGGLLERLEAQHQLLLAIEDNDPARDVVLVGHSCGTYVAAMLAAGLKRDPQAVNVGSRLRLLTLGQNLIHLAGLPEAEDFRDDLRTLAVAPPLPWRDVSSLDDWISGAGVNPYDLAGLQRPAHPYPDQQVVPLRQRLGLRSRWSLLNNQFRLHFQYFQAVPASVDSGGFDLIDELLMDVVETEVPALLDRA